jgi:hypothetical protein
MIKIELTDEEAEQYKDYCKFQSQKEAFLRQWNQVIDFSEQMGNGAFTLTVQNGIPVKILNPMQTVIIGLKI